MRNPIITIFDTCEDPRILCKSIRRVLHLSQRQMAKRLLTSQCYICIFETESAKRKMSDTEFKRILFNLKIDFEETVYNISQTFTSIGKEYAYLIFMQVLIEYLSLTSNKKNKDRKEVISLLEKFQDEFKRLGK